MLKIRALNREASSDEDLPVIRREAQEEIALEQYNKALRLQSDGELSEAEGILLGLINENIPQLENHGGLPHSMSTLKYSCFLNIGNIYIKKDEINSALDNYLSASELDSSDVTLWYKIGKLGIKQNRYQQAAYALSKGLECSESHWPCLDLIISLLFNMRDTVQCLLFIGKALMIDPSYVKGLVLRKQIYKDNPGTIEYYQKFNPDYVWEPSLDVSVDEEDEKIVLEAEQDLYNQISEFEKTLGPKPLQTIPLPMALEDFTWVSLGKVVTHLHQYITDNNMSHFTMIDVSKCMSRKVDEEIPTSKPVVEETELLQEPIEVQEKHPEVLAEEKMEVDKVVETVPERRPSQNSETNGDGQENTPSQTDNDEEQVMEQDIDDQEEVSDSKTDKNRGLNRSNKRKRDLLSDLQIWGWHSKRKSSKRTKTDKDFSVEDALNRIIPKSLLKDRIGAEKFNQFEDSMNTMDIYNMYTEDNNINFLSPIHSPKSSSSEAYFGTEREKEDVTSLWLKKRDYCDAIVLIKDFVMALAKLWKLKWPKELVQLYVEAYDMYMEHYDVPNFFSDEVPFSEMRDDALATLLNGEFLNFSSSKSESRVIHATSLAFLQVVSGWQENWLDEFPTVFIRVYWLRAHIFRKEDNNDLAIRALELIKEVIEGDETKTGEKFVLNMPNCLRCGFINHEIISKMLKHLDMMTSLNCIEGLFNSEKYTEVADILKLTFSMNNHPTIGKMGRPAQLAMLMHSLWYQDLTECFIWTEECLYEAVMHFLKPGKDFNKWEKIVEKCLLFFQEIIKMETVNIVDALNDDKRARLVETLCKIVCKQLNSENSLKVPLGTVTPWILLHYILVREEHRQQASKVVSHVKRNKTNEDLSDSLNSEELPPSVAVLFSAHEFLGPKGWCLASSGELLHFILDTILDRLDTPIFELLREKIDIHIEQALFCLYQHPSKKNKISRHLADHNVDPLSLSWERAFQLYEFYGPDSLPEFNSYKNHSINADTEQLLQRICALVPPECDPQSSVPKVTEYIQGKSNELPEPINFPNKVRALYYLIADFYFKQKEFNRCVKYFIMDLCINPNRGDSWACLSLSYASQLENKLSYCKKLKSVVEFLEKAKWAQLCFRKALDIEKKLIMLWIEYGSFEYMMHSFCSRVMKSDSDILSMERFEYLENEKNAYLESSGRCFERTIELYQSDEGEADERWLQYYMLGKVAEKQQKEPQDYLEYYVTASKLLHENKAVYPDKINYHNPPLLAIEALELHYRLNASILKYLELREGKEIPNSIGNLFKQHLDKSIFGKKTIIKEVIPAVIAEKVDKAKDEEIEREVRKCLGNILDDIVRFETVISKSDVTTISKPEVPTVSKPEAPTVSEKLEPLTVSNQPETSTVSKQPEPPTVSKQPEPQTISQPEVPTISNPEGPESTTATDSADEDCKIVNFTPDIIDISDSDDEHTKVQVKDVPEVAPNPNPVGEDVQDLLDKMMAETMKKTEEQELDSDTSTTSKIVTEVKLPEETPPEEIQPEKIQPTETQPAEVPVLKPKHGKSHNKPDKLKSGSETDDRRTSVDDSSSSSSSSSSSTSSSESDSDDDSSSSSSSSSSEASNGNMSNADIISLIDKCVVGLEQCVIRFPQNYKALYRLAHLYYNYKAKRDLTKCKQLFLGEYTCKGGVVITGLFSDRKNQNFFNGIWRIPSSEIDRPGSLSAHMSRCIMLLLQILRDTSDSKVLMDLFMQLRRIPDSDKIYIKDSDRIQFAEQAMTMCIQCLRSQIQNATSLSEAALQKLLQDIFRSYQRVQKNDVAREATFATMLTDVYRKYKKEQIPENANVLELATKFCLSNRLVEKQKRQQVQTQASLLRGPGVTTSSPVLPSPSTIGPSNQPPLKRPGSGRPRGRPPLPKVPGQPRAPKGRGTSNIASNPYLWQKSLLEQNAAIINQNYLKHYQEELLKQYSKSLNLSQYQFNPFFNQNLSNTFQSQFHNQFLASQNPLMNNPAFLKQLMSQFESASSKSFKKKSDSLPATPSGLTVEPLKQFPQMSKAPKKNLPHTITSSSLSSSQGTTITKVKSTLPSNMPYNFPKKDNLQSVAKTSSVFNPNMFKSNYGMNYSTADFAKVKSSTAVTKTSSSQVFKEPSISKHRSVDKSPNLLMKERPSISITPVLSGAMPPFPPPLQSSTPNKAPGKTLQEKLADKQKQSSKHMGRNIEADIIPTDLSSSKKNVPNLPSSLVVSKTLFPMDSGISISQVPMKKPSKSHVTAKKIRRPALEKIPIYPTAMPKKPPERKPSPPGEKSSDDDVIIIE